MPTPASAPASPSGAAATLERRLGLPDAVLLGVGSMLGAGVFAVLAPAARAAGDALLLGLLVAAVVAYANAMSTAQLAAVIPEAGGAYRYGRDRLGPWWGFTAGWGFVVGKTASCAAMAATFAAYAAPGWQRPAAVAAVVLLVAVNGRGITRTAGLTRVLVAATSVVLAVVVVVGAGAVLGPGGRGPVPGPTAPAGAGTSLHGVLQSAGLLFFAMAGYARIATLGAEVRDPGRVIPRAVATALGLVLTVYAAVAVVALAVLGADRLGGAAAPLAEVLVAAGRPEWGWLVRAGAAVASLGALLGLVAGVGRTAWAMAREGDLPGQMAVLHPRFRVPHVAERVVGGAVVVLVLVADVTTLIGFSSFGVLVYYAVANAAALTQRGAERRWPRALHVVGLAGCAALALSLPPTSALTTAVVLALGLVARAVVQRRSRRGAPPSGTSPCRRRRVAGR